MADAIDFDPATASPVERSSGFDPSSATPVTNTRTDGFDPSSARPIDDHLRDVANDVLARHHAGEAELDDESLKGLIETAYKDRSPWQGVKDWASGVASGITHPSGIYDKIKGGLSTAGKAMGEFISTGDEDSKVAQNVMAGAVSAPLDVLNVGQSLGVGAANLVDQGLPRSHERRIDRIVRSEKLAHDINASVKGVNDYLGADPSDPLNESTRFLAQAFLPVKGAGEVSGPIAKAADVAVENAPRVAKAAAPAAVGGATALAGHPKLGVEIAAAGYGLPMAGKLKVVRGIINMAKKAAADTEPESTSLFNDFVDAASKAPSQTPMFTYIKQGVDDRIASLQKVTGDFRAANQGKIKFADDPTVDVKDLKGPDKELREKLDQLKFLQQRSDSLKTASDVNKVLTYGGKLSLATAGNAVAGGAIMGGISASQAQPQQVEQASREGFQTGAALSLPFAPLQAHGALQDLRMSQGRDALAGKGAKIVDPKSLEGLTDEQKTNVLTTAGAAGAVGVKTVVLSPEEYAKMIAPQRPDVVPTVEGAPQEQQQVNQQAPNGHYDPNTKTIYLNRDAIGEGTAGHELQHPLQQLWGQTLRENDPSWVQTYDDLLAKTGQKRTTSSQSERDAEVGRVLLQNTPIEAFYGGESGADVVKRVANNLLQRIMPDRYSETMGTTELGAPYSKGDLGEMSQRMFRLGEEAAKAPRNAPSEPQATSVPPSEQTQSTAPTQAPSKSIEQVVGEVDQAARPRVIPVGGVDPQEAVDFLVKMGQTKESAIAKAHAAVQDLKGEGTPITLENIVKKAMQRAIPKPVESVVNEVDQVAKSSVASTKSDTNPVVSTETPSGVTQAAVKTRDGQIFTGVNHADAASKMVKAGYKTNELYDWNQQGFVRNGEWIGGPEAEKLALDMPGNAKATPPNEEPSRTPTETIPQTPTEPAPERGVAGEVQAPVEPSDHPDYEAVRTQAETAKREELSGTRRKTKEQEISRAGLEAMAQAHAKHVGDDADLVTWRTDRFGDTSIGGKSLDLSDPFHQHLIEKAGLTPKQVEYVNQFSDNMGKLLGLENYSHAAKGGEATGVSRKTEQKESTAQQRAEKKGDTQNAPVNIVPTWIKFNQPSNLVTVHGFNPDKLLSNAAKLESYPESGFKKAYPKGVNDPQIVQDLSNWLANNRNGYTGDGRKQIEGTPLMQVKPNEDYEPAIIPHDRFQVLNAMMGSSEPMGKTPKSADAQILGQQNAGFVRPNESIFNQVRAKLAEKGDVRDLLENVNESLRPENISGKVSNEPVADEHLLRPSGAKPETVKAIADVIGEKGTPRYSQSGFMPATPKHLDAVAKELGLRYDGPSLGGKAHQFTDDKTKSSIDVPKDATPEQVKQIFETSRKLHKEPPMQFMPKSDDKRAIKMAAVKFPDGKIYEDWFHPTAFAEGVSQYSVEQLAKWIREHGEHDYIQTGFTTNGGEFLDRHQALERAKEIGQVTDSGMDEARKHFGGLSGPRGLESLNFARAREFKRGGIVKKVPKIVRPLARVKV